jgi:hypothetical protein
MRSKSEPRTGKGGKCFATPPHHSIEEEESIAKDHSADINNIKYYHCRQN